MLRASQSDTVRPSSSFGRVQVESDDIRQLGGNSGSVLNLNFCTRRGCKPYFRQMR
jgi:hypothetical protein